MIYADNAATTKLDIDAFESMRPYLLENYGNASQPYRFSRLSRNALKDSREIIAACINASPEEIYFTSGGTESDNWAIKGTIDFSDRQSVITSAIEHHAVLNACQSIEKLGIPISHLPVDKFGIISVESLKSALTEKTKLVSIMLANNEIGTIEPVADLVDLSHRYGALFHTDAVQALGHIPVDVQEIGVDLLSASGHKFNAPKGVGFLYIKNGTKISPYADGGLQERSLRAGTENVASIVAMAHALKKNCMRMNKVAERLYHMEEIFLHALDVAGVDYIRNGAASHIPGNISISIRNAMGELLLHRLDLKGVCISTGSACDSQYTHASHVIQAIEVPEEYAKGTIRISFGVDNVESEAVDVAKAIIDVICRSY